MQPRRPASGRPSGYSCYVATGDSEPRCWRGAGTSDVDAGPPPDFLRVEITRPGINDDEPAEGATVFLDAPDGTRRMTSAVANGAATFDAIVWDGRPYALTVVLPGHRVETRVATSPGGFGAPRGTLPLHLELAPPPDAAYTIDLTIRDAPTGAMDLYRVTTERPGSRVDRETLPVELTLLHGGDTFANDLSILHYYEQEPMDGMLARRRLVLAMVESHRDSVEGPGPIARETIYDGATSTETIRSQSASFTIPTWLDDEADVEVDVRPTSLESEGELTVGLVTSLRRQERTFFYDLAFATPSFLGTLVTLVEAKVGREGAFTAVVEPAPTPTEEPSETRSPSFLRWPTRTGGTTRMEPLRFATDEGATIVRLRRGADGLAVWDVVLEPGLGELRWPTLPAEGETTIGAGPWRAQVLACAGEPQFRRGPLCERVAGSPVFELR